MGKLSENPQPEEVPEKGANAEIMKEPVTEKEEYLALCQLVNPIAQPLASRKLARKLYKLVKKSVKEKGSLRHGLSDVMKAIRKNEKGILILAGYKRPAIVLMVKKHESYNELYDDVYSLVNSLVVEP
uniref:Ribonucloprotein n=1 Tax=Meloidogyne hapla TaxID=6305 RepID=A0A1I8B741_MELHA